MAGLTKFLRSTAVEGVIAPAGMEAWPVRRFRTVANDGPELLTRLDEP